MRSLLITALFLCCAMTVEAKDYRVSCLSQAGVYRYVVMKSILLADGTWGPESEAAVVYASTLPTGRSPTTTITVAPNETAKVWLKVCGANPMICTSRLDAQYLLTPALETPPSLPPPNGVGIQ